MLDKNKSSFTIDLQAYTSRVSTEKMHLYIDLGVVEKEIREVDIRTYQKVGLINAMIDFEEMPVIAIEQIFYGIF